MLIVQRERERIKSGLTSAAFPNATLILYAGRHWSGFDMLLGAVGKT
jgi:hypothetical protein